MKKTTFAFYAFSLLLLFSTSASQAQPVIKTGDKVFAEWTVNGWYHGTVGEICGEDSFMILFDDGDKKCCIRGNIAADVIPSRISVLPGKAVLAQWSDGRYYPGTVSMVKDGTYYINFNDGDKGEVTLEQIRLRDKPLNRTMFID